MNLRHFVDKKFLCPGHRGARPEADDIPATSALSQLNIRVVDVAGVHTLACFFSPKAVRQLADHPNC